MGEPQVSVARACLMTSLTFNMVYYNQDNGLNQAKFNIIWSRFFI